VNLVIAFGADDWRAVAPDLASFTAVGDATATQHDAWLLWISGASSWRPGRGA
jgi:hypothetical protein